MALNDPDGGFAAHGILYNAFARNSAIMGNVILPTKECDMRNLTELAMAMAAGLFLLAAPIEVKAKMISTPRMKS